MFPAFDYLTSFLERVDSPCSYIRLVCFSPGSNFWVTNCCCTPVGARRKGGRNGLHEVEIGREGGLFRCPLSLSCPPDVTSLYGALLCAEMRRLGGATRMAKGVGWRRRSINIKLSVQHLYQPLWRPEQRHVPLVAAE